MRPKIWVDCDGVLADFVDGYLNLLNLGRDGDSILTHADVTSWDLRSLDADADAAWHAINTSTSFCFDLCALEGAYDGLDSLRALGDVACATAPVLAGTWMHQRADWLLARGFEKRDIVFAEDKSWLMGDVLIDDRVENCLEWQARNPHGLAILFDQPWNRDNDTLVRACGWPATVGYVERWVALLSTTGAFSPVPRTSV